MCYSHVITANSSWSAAVSRRRFRPYTEWESCGVNTTWLATFIESCEAGCYPNICSCKQLKTAIIFSLDVLRQFILGCHLYFVTLTTLRYCVHFQQPPDPPTDTSNKTSRNLNLLLKWPPLSSWELRASTDSVSMCVVQQIWQVHTDISTRFSFCEWSLQMIS